jgi:hypothetical protein
MTRYASCRRLATGLARRLLRLLHPGMLVLLDRGLLNDHGPFDGIEDLQKALDAWREDYNTDRPKIRHRLGLAGYPALRIMALAETGAT